MVDRYDRAEREDGIIERRRGATRRELRHAPHTCGASEISDIIRAEDAVSQGKEILLTSKHVVRIPSTRLARRENTRNIVREMISANAKNRTFRVANVSHGRRETSPVQPDTRICASRTSFSNEYA